MRITRIYLKNYKKFEEFEINFDKNINLIVGNNEVGKSSVMEAIKLAFYTEASTRSKTLLDHIRPWLFKTSRRPHPYIELDYEEKGQNYKLIRDFKNRISKIINVDTGVEETDTKVVGEMLLDATGVATKEIFESTVHIDQEDISKIRKSQSLLSAIQNAASASGQEGNVQEVIKDITKEIQEYQRGLKSPAKNPGILKQMYDIRDAARADFDEVTEKWEILKSEIVKQKNISDKIRGIKRKLEDVSGQIEKHQASEKLDDKLKVANSGLEKVSQRIKQVEDLQIQRQKVNIKLNRYSNLKDADFADIADKIGQIERDLESKKENIQKHNAELVNLKKLDEKVSLMPAYYTAGGAVIAIIATYLFTQNILFALAWIIVPVAVYGFFSYQKTLKSKTSQINELEERIIGLNDILRVEEKKVEEVLAKYGLESRDEFFMAKATISGNKSNIEQLENAERSILMGEDLASLKKQEASLMTEKRTLDAEKESDPTLKKMPMPQFLRAKREMDMLEGDLKRLEMDKTKAETRISDSTLSEELIKEKEEVLESAENKLMQSKYRYKVLVKTKELIEVALNDTSAVATKIVKGNIDKYLSQITNGRYDRAKLDKNFDITVFSKELDGWVDPVQSLSSGTKDQIYLLVRLAFAKLVAQGANPPILLDDVFLTFDSSRFKNAMEMLRDISTENQIFIFSHQSNLDLGVNKIVLE